jgi:hypothetical protein
MRPMLILTATETLFPEKTENILHIIITITPHQRTRHSRESGNPFEGFSSSFPLCVNGILLSHSS